MERRTLLSAGAATSLAAIAGCASSAASVGPGTGPIFAVAQPMLPIAGSSEMFPVRRIYCIGRNYAAHSREMGSDPTRERPSSFKSRATRSSTSRPARRPITPIRR